MMNPEKTESYILKVLVIVGVLILIAPLFTGIVSADPDVLYFHSEQMTLGSTTGYTMTTCPPTSSTATTFVIDSTNKDIYFFEGPAISNTTTIAKGTWNVSIWCDSVSGDAKSEIRIEKWDGNKKIDDILGTHTWSVGENIISKDIDKKTLNSGERLCVHVTYKEGGSATLAWDSTGKPSRLEMPAATPALPSPTPSDTIAPTSSISSPVNGATVSGTVVISGTASDDGGSGVAKVEVGITPEGGLTTWYTASGTTSWSYSWDTTKVSNGSYAIQSRATDNAGNVESPSTGITVVVDNPPIVSVTSNVYGYLDQYVYWFGKGNSSSYTAPWTDDSTPSDYVIFPHAKEEPTTELAKETQEFCTIRAFVIILDDKGAPLPGQTVKMWTINDDGYKIIKNANDDGDGRYSAVWEAWKQPNRDTGGYKASGTDGDAMYGKFTSRQIYYVYVDVDGDGVSDLDLPFMAYCVGDTVWGAGLKGKPPRHCEECGNAHAKGADAHYDYDRVETSTCADCHGWLDGVTPSSSTLNYGAIHPRAGASTYADCNNAICHGDTYLDSQPVPGYSGGTYNITAPYFNDPSWCENCHVYKDGVIPTAAGHNNSIECKYCHSDDFHNLLTFADTPGYSAYYPGTCYQDCHQVQNKHNDAVECDQCHAADSAPMHTSDLTAFRTTCGACHQNAAYDAPQVSYPLHHSEDPGSGAKWGTYWTPDADESACNYCHGNTRHSKQALGRPAEWRGTNIVNSSVNDSYWCAGCHYQGYQSGTKTYNDMVSAFNASGLPIPPEITNGTYAPNVTRFYEHVCANWSDALCRECHGKFVTSHNVTELMHDVSDGSCGNCHYDFEYMNNTKHAPTKYVNSTMFNASVHGPSSGIGCVDCHTTSNHPYPEYYWKWCECCHAVQSNPVDDTDRHNITPDVRNNMVDGVSVLGIIDCKMCHNATSYENAKENAKTDFVPCRWCHTYPDKVYE